MKYIKPFLAIILSAIIFISFDASVRAETLSKGMIVAGDVIMDFSDIDYLVTRHGELASKAAVLKSAVDSLGTREKRDVKIFAGTVYCAYNLKYFAYATPQRSAELEAAGYTPFLGILGGTQSPTSLYVHPTVTCIDFVSKDSFMMMNESEANSGAYWSYYIIYIK